MRILVVEDSAPMRKSISRGLTREGFVVDTAEDGVKGLSLARNNPYDVLVLDLMLPLLDGHGVLAGLNGKEQRPHVLVLTAKDGVEDRVQGLNEGADDYLVKPFAFAELVARVRALVRRRYDEREAVLCVGPLTFDPKTYSACLDGQALDLSVREFSLLEYLMTRHGETVTREEIEDHIYGVERLPSSNAVDSTICVLRAKLGPAGKELIRTRRGMGYVLGQAFE